ncbi:MAG TPA: RNA-binding protein [Actinomycetales bacterium]|nr:RNA-binding protein [Actinomycetales bacterium]
MLADALEHLVRGIVDHPDDVTVTSPRQRRGQLLKVHVNPEDLGRVIGRGGRTARALRTVIGAINDGAPVRVDVVDVDRH